MNGKQENFVDSQNDVITTVSHVLYEFENLVNKYFPNSNVVYTEELDFENGLKKILGKDNYQTANPSRALPFLAYNRTILKEISDRHLGRRAKSKIGCTRVLNESVQYAMAFAEFDIQFFYASSDVKLMEQFEVTYNSGEGLASEESLIVDMDVLGQFNYYTEFKELTEKTINREDTYYKLLIGSATVRGFYFTFRTKSAIIKEINKNIIASKNLADVGNDENISAVTII